MSDELEPEVDPLFHLGVPDELLKHYLSQSRAAGMVYALVVKQIIGRIYRDHDYIKRKEIEGKPLGYADVLRTDMQAFAWALKAMMLYVPEEVRQHPIPPQPPRPRRTRQQTRQAIKEREERRKSRDVRYQQGND